MEPSPYKLIESELKSLEKVLEKSIRSEVELATQVAENLRSRYPVFYDETGSIGRRYARQDEAGTPFAVTIDYESLDNYSVTVRDRDTMEQQRIAIADLEQHFAALLAT